jgi:Nuclease-related domain
MLGSLLTVIYIGWQLGGDVRSLTWIWGQIGEQQTEDVLKPLERVGWRVIHDIPNARGNWDHVVVGPGGLFLLDTKTSERKAFVKDDRLYLGRTTFNGAAFRGSAKSLHTALAEHRPPFAQAVVAIWADFPARHQEERDVIYIAGGELAEWLSSRPPKLAAPRVVALASAIEGLRG